MQRQMQCCQLCLRPRRCAAAAPAVRTDTVPHVSVAGRSTSDRSTAEDALRCARRCVRWSTHVPLHRPVAVGACDRSRLDLDRLRSHGLPGAASCVAACECSEESGRPHGRWHHHDQHLTQLWRLLYQNQCSVWLSIATNSCMRCTVVLLVDAEDSQRAVAVPGRRLTL